MIKVTAGIIIKDDKVLIARRKPTGRLPGLWEFPGGKIEAGETPEQCLKRELKEEFGIDVTIGEYVGNSVYQYEFGIIDLLAFKVGRFQNEIRLNDHSAIAWVSSEDIHRYQFTPADIHFVEMIVDGRIQLTGEERKIG